MLKNYLFGAIIYLLTKNVNPDKYLLSGYGIGFNSRPLFSNFKFDFAKNVIFGVDNSSSKHADDRKRPTQRIR